MNKDLNNTNNFLFSTNNYDINKFLQFAIELAKESKISLFISAHQQVNLLSLVEYKDKDILKNIVFMYFSAIEEVVKKLLELHLWSIRPNFIVVDLDGFFRETCIYPFKQKICFLISSLFSYVDSLENKNLNSQSSVVSCSAIVINKLENDCSHKSNVVQILIDFYFYNSAYSDFNMLCKKVERTMNISNQ